MKTYEFVPLNHAVIHPFTFPGNPDTRFNELTITVEVWCNGCEAEVDVTWKRCYESSDIYESEWDTPAFNMPAWDQCNGTVSRADRMRAYECLLDVTDQFFTTFLKGK